MRKFIPFLFLFTICIGACTDKQDQLRPLEGKIIGDIINQLTDIMVHDVTNPPLAARFFTYASLAGYEIIHQNDPSIPGMHGKLNGYPLLTKPEGLDLQNQYLSATFAILETAKKLQPSGPDLLGFENNLLDSLKQLGFKEKTIQQSMAYGKAISQEILVYAKSDKYNEISNYPRYTPLGTDGAWYPTPPGYFTPVEPYFNTIRPFTLETSDQFKPAPPVAFSSEKNSEFFRLMEEVYKTEQSKENLFIAAFWDCNPFALEEKGHMLVGMKLISPGAHWMGIANIACRDAGLDFSRTLEVNTLVAIALTDGFIACWDEKYRSHRVRPETAIRKYINPTYTPLLQTPPFPEYLSGHSVISTAAATVLTHYFGDDFAYTDTVEERFGMGTRDFGSFLQAADEAAISRLYGGIHFMDAITEGQDQGKKVGDWIIQKTEGRTIASR